MAALRGTSRRQVGSESWILEERACALQIVETEAEEFAFSARNELDWLNEHMAEIFDENQLNVAEIFKTPGRLRGKTPRTARKRNPLEARTPLSEVFSATPRPAQIFAQKFLEPQVSKFQVAEDPPEHETGNEVIAPKPVSTVAHKDISDSGYFGSQATQETQAIQATQTIGADETLPFPDQLSIVKESANDDQQSIAASVSAGRRTTETSFQSAKEEQSLALNLDETKADKEINTTALTLDKSAPESLPQTVVDEPPLPQQPLGNISEEHIYDQDEPNLALKTHEVQDMQSPSDGSSPIRPIVRKSSLTFASLPAREPLTTKKSFGNRTSRTSQLEQSRTSYYGRYAENKALGDIRYEDRQAMDEMDEIDVVDDVIEPQRERSSGESEITRLHNKTSTQRLQDQISLLGKPQSNAPRPSKSIPNTVAIAPQLTYPTLVSETRQVVSPVRNDRAMAGAFPDDEDDWIGPRIVTAAASVASPRPAPNKDSTADVMGSTNDKGSIGGPSFNVPKLRRDDLRHLSPLREPGIPERTSSTLGHIKSASTSALRPSKKDIESVESPPKKGISVSNPNLGPIIENSDVPTTPPKSPSRSLRDSPLKAAKDKVYSILKTSKNLFASSAAVSAAAKGSTLSPAPSRLGNQSMLSLESIPQQQAIVVDSSLYPNLGTDAKSQTQLTCSPSMDNIRKTRASAEREGKKKDKEAKEIKEAQKMDEKLGKLREKESEKARAFSQQERERIAAMEKQLLAKKELERMAKATEVDVPRTTRSSPRKAKAQMEAEDRVAAVPPPMDGGDRDVEMIDVSSMPPPPISTAVSQSTKPRDQMKRPVKPTKEVVTTKQAPVVIRVDTGSQRNPQRNQFHPSNSALAASLAESLAPSSTVRAVAPQPTQKNKAGGSSLRSKVSVSSIKSVSSTTGRVKALEAAAKKKEQEDQEAQRKRIIKQENDRKRAAIQEEKQQEQRRLQEAAKQREREREHATSQMESKKIALMKRMEIENAKQQRPPPPAPRPQPIDLTNTSVNDKALPPATVQRVEQGQPKPPCMASTANKLQEEFTWSINSAYQNTTKAPPKRPLPQEAVEESQSRSTVQRNGLSNHQQVPDAKRRRTNDNQDGDVMESQPRGAMAPPVRQSGIRQKDGQTKSLFPNGYANVSQSSYNGQPLHKVALNAQHVHQAKPPHPMDMAQTSKAAITFAPNTSQAAGPTHKTPARPVGPAAAGGKSTSKRSAKSSPRYRNGDSIILPEIHTDSDSEDSDEGGASNFPIPGWANSPALRNGLIRQEGVDPATVFGHPGEIKLEEVFKNKDRHARFRARTSSANWSGNDKLTEEEVRRDLEARERLRREGGWSYGLS